MLLMTGVVTSPIVAGEPLAEGSTVAMLAALTRLEYVKAAADANAQANTLALTLGMIAPLLECKSQLKTLGEPGWLGLSNSLTMLGFQQESLRNVQVFAENE